MKYLFKTVSTCNMCGSSEAGHKLLGQRLNQSQGFRPKSKSGISVSIFKCRNCSLIFSNPLPIPNNIQDHYGLPAEDYWNEEYFIYKEDYFSYELDKLEQLMKITPEMKALDIGAGLGKCMISLERRGFDAYGFEPSRPFYDQALAKMKISPHRLQFGMMEEVDFPAGQFDFITFGAVLEHLYDPAASISKAMQWLRPGGIVHIEVPSSRYLVSGLLNFYNRLAGTNYVSHLSPMHPPFHLYEFTDRSFAKLGEQLGFSILDSEIAVGRTLFPSPVRFILDKYMRMTGKGMQLIIWLKKN